MAGELEAEGRRLGVDAVAAADAHRLLVFARALFEGGEQPVEIGEQQVAGLDELHRKAGVEHVGRGHALVDEACLRADMLGEIGQKGDDVVFGLRLDLVDAGDFPLAALPDRLGGGGGYDAECRLGIAGMRLDLEPDAELVLGRPDGGHFGTAVTRDHGGKSGSGS